MPLSASGAAPLECSPCHPKEAAAHAASSHAHALQPVLLSHFYRSLPERPIGEARGGFLLTYQLRDDALEVSAERGGQSAQGLIEWVFGAGRQAETPIVRRGRQYFEHRVSYYVNVGRFDLTIGHVPGVSRSAEDALGVLQTAGVIQRCFGCHSTGGLPGTKSFQPGVLCEVCHPGAERHARGGPAPDSKRQNAKTVVNFCASCHRGQAEGSPDDPINVRYQPVRLRRSRCFQLGDISCLNCHDPHAAARQDASWYRSRCLVCHLDQKDRDDCLPCHMPRIALTPRLVFTDHYIRTQAPAAQR